MKHKILLILAALGSVLGVSIGVGTAMPALPFKAAIEAPNSELVTPVAQKQKYNNNKKYKKKYSNNNKYNKKYSNKNKYKYNNKYRRNKTVYYSRSRYGPRYRYKRPGYGYYYGGYYYQRPWWTVGVPPGLFIVIQ